MRVSLRSKTIFGVAAIEGLMLLLLIITAIGFLTNVIDETLTKRAQSTATLFATTTKDAVLSFDLASLETFIDELLKNPDIAYAKVFDQNEQLLASGGQESLIDRPFSEDKQLSDVVDGVFDSFALISEEQFYFGRVELGISIQPTQEAIANVQAWSLSIAFFELFLVASFSFLLGTYLTRQLKALSRGAEDVMKALKSRDFDNVEVNVKGNDELSELAKSFNALVKSLKHELNINQQHEDELQELNSQLEDKVNALTAALSAKNTELLCVNLEMKETQQQLLQAEKMASVGQLAAGVAHEINNPIGFVTSNISTLKDYISAYQLLVLQAKTLVKAELRENIEAHVVFQELLNKGDFDFINDDVDELLAESTEGLTRVTKIVEGLKLFSRVDADEKKMVDLNHCLKTTLNMVKNELKYDSDLETQFSTLPAVNINVGKLSQVFTNVLINAGHAIKATETFGKIIVSTEVVEKHVIVNVIDNGIGMSADTLSKIFNPFYTTKPEGAGTGLGLSISIGIIAEHGGEMTAESQVGKGTRFIIKLPIESGEET